MKTIKQTVNKVVIKKIDPIIKIEIKYPTYEESGGLLDYSQDGKSDDIDDLMLIIMDCIEDIDNYDDDGGSISLDIKESNKSNLKTIKFNLLRLPFCCGIIEIGRLDVCNTLSNIEIKKVLEALVKSKKGITYIINTNGDATSRKFDSALEISEYFTLVKTFRNSNSGNIIKSWMSNND